MQPRGKSTCKGIFTGINVTVKRGHSCQTSSVYLEKREADKELSNNERVE